MMVFALSTQNRSSNGTIYTQVSSLSRRELFWTRRQAPWITGMHLAVITAFSEAFITLRNTSSCFEVAVATNSSRPNMACGTSLIFGATRICRSLRRKSVISFYKNQKSLCPIVLNSFYLLFYFFFLQILFEVVLLFKWSTRAVDWFSE